MKINKKKIKEGIDLTVITDPKFKTDVVSVSFLTGEGTEAAVCSSLTAGVLSRSSARYPSLLELNRTLDLLYDAQLTTDAARRGLTHIPVFTVRSLNNRYSLDKTDIRGGCLDVLYNIITDPATHGDNFRSKILNSEKVQLTEAINAIRNNRSGYALRRCTGELMKDEERFAPRLGDVETVAQTRKGELNRFYKNMMKNAPVRIISSSADDDGRINEFAEKLGETLGGRKDGSVSEPEFRAAQKKPERVVEEFPVSQDVLCLGCTYDCSAGDGNSAARALFHEIFFQNPTSRLFVNVREKLSLCYYCSAAPMSDLKKMIIYAGVDGKNAEKAEDEIRKQLELIKKGVTEEELQRGRQAIKNDLLSICDSPSRIAGWYASRELYGSDETPAEFEAKLGLITPDDIARVASSVDLSLVYTLKGTAENEA